MVASQREADVGGIEYKMPQAKPSLDSDGSIGSELIQVQKFPRWMEFDPDQHHVITKAIVELIDLLGGFYHAKSLPHGRTRFEDDAQEYQVGWTSRKLEYSAKKYLG